MELGKLSGIIVPKVRDNCTHVYYVYQMILDIKLLNIKEKKYMMH